MFPSGSLCVGLDSAHSRIEPLRNRTVSIVVEGVHADVAESALKRIGIPSLPNGGSTLTDRVEPAGVACLEKERVAKRMQTELFKCLIENTRADKARREGVIVVNDLLFKSVDINLTVFLGNEVERECKQISCLCLNVQVAVFDISASEVRNDALTQLCVMCRTLGLAEDITEFLHKRSVVCIVSNRDISLVGHVVVEPVTVSGVGTLKAELLEILHIILHRVEMLAENFGIVIHLIELVGNDKASISPSGVAVVAVKDSRDNVAICAVEALLRVARIAEPLVHKGTDVGKVCSRARKDLRVASPAKTLVTLRTVGGCGEVVSSHTPDDIGIEAVDLGIVAVEITGLGEFGANDLTRNRENVDVVVGADLKIAEAEEGVGGEVGLDSVARSDVNKARECGAVVLDIHTALGTVVSARGIAAVVEHFGKVNGDLCAAGCLEHKDRAADHILTHIKDQSLAKFEPCLLAPVADALGEHVDLAVFRAVMDGAVVANSRNGAQKKLMARSDSGTDKGNDLAGAIGEVDSVYPLVCLGSDGGLGHGGVVVFAVPDVGKHNGTANGSLPVLARCDDLVFAVSVFDLDLACECRRLEAVESEGDPARPPTGRNLRNDAVVFLAERGDVVFVFKYAVAVVGPTGLVFVRGGNAVDLVTDARAVYEYVEDTECSCTECDLFDSTSGLGCKLAKQVEKTLTRLEITLVAVEFHIFPRMLDGISDKRRMGYKSCFFHNVLLADL